MPGYILLPIVVDLVRIMVPVLVVAMVLGLGFYSLLSMDQEGETAYAPWPMDRGNNRNDCVSPYKADGPPFTLDWELEIESPYYAYPMIMGPEDSMFFRVQNQSTYVNECIYGVDSEGLINWTVSSVTESFRYPLVLGPDLNLYAADGANVSCYGMDGEMNWSVEVGPEPWLTVTADRIYVFTTGKLTALFLNGSQDWELDLEVESATQSLPVVAEDGTIHVAYYFHGDIGYDKTLLAVNPNGTVKWNTVLSQGSLEVGMWFDPVVGSDGMVYISDDEDSLMAIAPNGTIMWEYDYEGWTFVAALGEDGTVYLGETGFVNNPGYVHAIDPDGGLLWTYEAPVNTSISSMVVDEEGTILFGGYGGIYALDQEGNLKWSYEVQDYVFSIVVGEEGAIYFMRYDDSGTILGKISGQ